MKRFNMKRNNDDSNFDHEVEELMKQFNDNQVPPDMSDRIDASAKFLFQQYHSLTNAGFSDDQAMSILLTGIAA